MGTNLIIDTSSNETISVCLSVDGRKGCIKEKIGKQKAQVVLPLIEKLLEKHHLKLQDISSIRVNEGPGSFTGLRVGISVANALGFSLQIPVNGKKIGKFATPQYQ